MNKSTILLAAGDTLVIALVTVIGFATHGEANTSVLPRMAATFLPLAFAWFLAAVLLRLFDPQTVSRPDQLWRPLAAIIFAGPLAAGWKRRINRTGT